MKQLLYYLWHLVGGRLFRPNREQLAHLVKQLPQYRSKGFLNIVAASSSTNDPTGPGSKCLGLICKTSSRSLKMIHVCGYQLCSEELHDGTVRRKRKKLEETYTLVSLEFMKVCMQGLYGSSRYQCHLSPFAIMHRSGLTNYSAARSWKPLLLVAYCLPNVSSTPYSYLCFFFSFLSKIRRHPGRPHHRPRRGFVFAPSSCAISIN